MRTPKKPSTANSANMSDSKPVDPKANKSYDDDDFDEQIDDLGGFDEFSSYDDDDDY